MVRHAGLLFLRFLLFLLLLLGCCQLPRQCCQPTSHPAGTGPLAQKPACSPLPLLLAGLVFSPFLQTPINPGCQFPASGMTCALLYSAGGAGFSVSPLFWYFSLPSPKSLAPCKVFPTTGPSQQLFSLLVVLLPALFTVCLLWHRPPCQATSLRHEAVNIASHPPGLMLAAAASPAFRAMGGGHAHPDAIGMHGPKEKPLKIQSPILLLACTAHAAKLVQSFPLCCLFWVERRS